jgi:hypothetical protein
MGNVAPAATADSGACARAARSADPNALLRINAAGPVLSVDLNRPAKRNALNDGIILMATVAQSDKEAKLRIRAFLDRKTANVKPA